MPKIEQKQHEEIETFIKCLKDIYLKGKTGSQSENDSFNIFYVLGIENKEVLACRFIGELLDPNGSHGLKELPLKLFMINVLGVTETEIKDCDLKKASVILEDVIDNNRRVDIVLKVKDRTYPIEVKINACDQDSQLQDYYNYYFNEQDGKIYYLTPTGWKPSESSKGKLEKESIVRISFVKIEGSDTPSIANWLDKLIKKISKQNEAKSIFMANILEQYKGVIEKMNKEIEINAILREVGIDNLNFPEDEDTRKKLFGLINTLAANGDRNGVLQKTIQKAYLKRFLDFDKNTYELQDTITEDHKYAIWSICNKKDINDPIAWICVDTNLYIECEDRDKENANRRWHEKDNWAYIHPDGCNKRDEKKFQLDNCINIIKYCDIENNKINIEKYLKDISNSN